MDVRAIARICHEVNRAYSQSLGEDPPSWEDAPQWMRDSAIDGVQFHIRNPQAGPEGSHANWAMHKTALGWGYGETKDAAKKTHPCLVPYDQLPVEAQIKDELFVAVVSAAVAEEKLKESLAEILKES